MKRRDRLYDIFDRLERHYGPTGWWPGDSDFEIAIGAILTQNTSWTNVERAIANLKQEDLLDPHGLLKCKTSRLESALRPSGYFRVKAKRVRGFCQYLVDNYEGHMTKMAEQALDTLRPELLAVYGIGPETADDIILYACHKPVFVVDAYTRRILSRHGLVPHDIGYEDLRGFFERHLESDVRLFQEYHGLIVWTGKDFCKTRPQCEGCPLAPTLRRGQPRLAEKSGKAGSTQKK